MYTNFVLVELISKLINYREILDEDNTSLIFLLDYVKNLKVKFTNDILDKIKFSKQMDKLAIYCSKEIIETKSLKILDDYKSKPKIIFYEKLLSIKGIGNSLAKKLIKKYNYSNLKDIDSKLLSETQNLAIKYDKDLSEKISYLIAKTIIKNLTETLFSGINNDELDDILDIKLNNNLKDYLKYVYQIVFVGSFRRKLKYISDIDCCIFVSDKFPFDEFDEYILKSYKNCYKLEQGIRNKSFLIKFNKKWIQIDFRFFDPKSKPFALLAFTGNFIFNKKLRSIAIQKGYSLSEYGLKNKKTNKFIDESFESEESIFNFLDFNYIYPEDRTFDYDTSLKKYKLN